MYKIEIRPDALEDLRRLRKFAQVRILDAIEKLRTDPLVESRNCKELQPGEDLPWALPVWELRIDVYRVFYRVEGDRVVIVLAVRQKGRKMTKEIL